MKKLTNNYINVLALCFICVSVFTAKADVYEFKWPSPKTDSPKCFLLKNEEEQIISVSKDFKSVTEGKQLYIRQLVNGTNIDFFCNPDGSFNRKPIECTVWINDSNQSKYVYTGAINIKIELLADDGSKNILYKAPILVNSEGKFKLKLAWPLKYTFLLEVTLLKDFIPESITEEIKETETTIDFYFSSPRETRLPIQSPELTIATLDNPYDYKGYVLLQSNKDNYLGQVVDVEETVTIINDNTAELSVLLNDQYENERYFFHRSEDVKKKSNKYHIEPSFEKIDLKIEVPAFEDCNKIPIILTSENLRKKPLDTEYRADYVLEYGTLVVKDVWTPFKDSTVEINISKNENENFVGEFTDENTTSGERLVETMKFVFTDLAIKAPPVAVLLCQNYNNLDRSLLFEFIQLNAKIKNYLEEKGVPFYAGYISTEDQVPIVTQIKSNLLDDFASMSSLKDLTGNNRNWFESFSKSMSEYQGSEKDIWDESKDKNLPKENADLRIVNSRVLGENKSGNLYSLEDFLKESENLEDMFRICGVETKKQAKSESTTPHQSSEIDEGNVSESPEVIETANRLIKFDVPASNQWNLKDVIWAFGWADANLREFFSRHGSYSLTEVPRGTLDISLPSGIPEGKAKKISYTVKNGDTLIGIANSFKDVMLKPRTRYSENFLVSTIKIWNGITAKEDNLRAGQELIIFVIEGD